MVEQRGTSLVACCVGFSGEAVVGFRPNITGDPLINQCMRLLRMWKFIRIGTFSKLPVLIYKYVLCL